MADFSNLWHNACSELHPDPKGAAGKLVNAIADLLSVEQVEYESIEDSALFLMDLGVLGFKGMDFNVIMISHPPRNKNEEKEQARLLSDYKRAVGSVGYCLHILLSLESPEPNEFIPSSLEAVVICGKDLERMFESKFPMSVLFGIIRRQAHIEQICPFNTDHEVRGGMFKGRKEELNRLTQDMESNFLISSSRRIGKTSLAIRAYDILRTRPEYKNRVFFFNCISWGGFMDCCSRIAHSVAPKRELRIERGTRNIAYLMERASNHGSQPLTFFFDELDRVVDAEASRDWPFFTVLAEAVRNRWARVVFIGYRSVEHLNVGANTIAHHMRLYSNSPFYRSLTPLNLKPLNQEEARSLILEPFDNIEIKVQNRHEVANHIWRNTKGHPFLIQFYGSRLFRKAVKRDPQEILWEDIEEIDNGRELDEFMETHFLENTIDKGKPVNAERICAILFAHYGTKDGFTQGDFVERSDDLGHPLTIDEVREALTNLVNSTIFFYDHRKYSFTFSIMGQILRENYPNIAAILKTVDLR